MADLNESIAKFLEYLSVKRIPEAKLMMNTHAIWGEGRLGKGRRVALQGIINLLNARSATLENLDQKLMRLEEIFSQRINTIWCDDFDKGYFEVWIKFIGYAKTVEGKVAKDQVLP